MPKVRVIEPYYDKVREEYPEVNTEFDVEEKRAKHLEKEGLVKILKETPNGGKKTEKAK